MRDGNETPKAIRLFRDAGAEPSIEAYEPAREIRPDIFCPAGAAAEES